jgi:hypothetical protein
MDIDMTGVGSMRWMHAAALLVCGICSASASQRVVHFFDNHSNVTSNAVLGNISAGSYTAHVWHPLLQPGQVEPTQKIVIASGPLISRTGFTILLLPICVNRWM